MNIKIYRGTHRIGGCCTEITTEKARILIDAGSELPGPDKRDKPPENLSVPGVTGPGPKCDAVFFTHIHGDHIGELERLYSDIPIYMGYASKWMLMNVNVELGRYGHGNPALHDRLYHANPYKAGEPVRIGDISVTPFYIDHSAFDSYMFLIEADGKRVLHTGDFRGSGFRGRKLIPMLKKYVGQVDWLICEGTLLSRDGNRMKTEYELQDDFRNVMKRYKKVFVLCSSTNIDRMAGIIHARPDKRPVIVDHYQMSQLEIVKEVCRQYVRLYDFRDVRYTSYRAEQLYKRYFNRKSFLCFIRANSLCSAVYDRYADDNTIIIYSMWNGYLKGETENKNLTGFLHGRPYVCLHTSGHADAETLKEVAEAVKPVQGIIPIHTECPEKFRRILPEGNIRILVDNEKFIL